MPRDELADELASAPRRSERRGRPSDELADDVAAAGVGRGAVPAPKVSAPDANYVAPGPAPFQCGACRWIVWGTSKPGYDPNDPDPSDDLDLCQIIEGPYEDGAIKPSDTCRFWTPKERVGAGRARVSIVVARPRSEEPGGGDERAETGR